MKFHLKHFIAAGLAAAVLGAAMAANPALADPLKDRQAAMKSISKANKVIVGYTKGEGDLKSAVAAANQIASLGKTIPSLFPQGSGGGYGMTTRAKPEIWSDWAKFQKASEALVMAASNFANWSQMGDADTLKSASGAIGKSCGGCHKAFRGPKPKK